MTIPAMTQIVELKLVQINVDPKEDVRGALAIRLAHELENNPECSVPAVSRELRAVMDELDSGESDDFDAKLAELLGGPE